MPLDKFTEATMSSLISGDAQIAVGTSKQRLEKYEQDKLDVMVARLVGRK